jgi:hypothetical protein
VRTASFWASLRESRRVVMKGEMTKIAAIFH